MLKRACLSIVVVALGVGGCTGKEQRRTAVATAPVVPSTGSAGASACTRDDSDQGIPRTAPRQVFWKRFEGVAVPFSSSVGPLDVRGDIARCYAHTARGALFAAVQISVRLDRSTRWRKIMEKQVVQGVGKQAFARVRAAGQRVPAGRASQIMGFRVVSYTPETAVVGTVSRDPVRGGYTARTTTVKWESDWKLAPTSAGSTGSVPQDVDSLSGYVFWGGFGPPRERS
ncbi:hypothetical protein BKA00_006616 [Actinomadura coerulea]|uniref:DUF8175 domain-containing protein n=1 Tax=Actinomadura coerulea TaxID=46159 RepID=A0A7X0G5D9_9ACTN|nr:hypothetical protein [Actinomadura coerulea]MBB6399702.1 hypothetical protein [Actinomadura coerulea]